MKALEMASRPRSWMVAALALLALGGACGAFLYGSLSSDLPWPEELDRGATVEATKIYDRHGRLLYEIARPEQGKGTMVPLGQIPPALQQATIATEDAHFYQHFGVDPLAIARAVLTGLGHGEIRSGGSTITQQLARNLMLSAEER